MSQVGKEVASEKMGLCAAGALGLATCQGNAAAAGGAGRKKRGFVEEAICL
jgi:hypothetical protein